MQKKWFQNWFNSPYYHILYKQRNYAEAEFFINNLCLFLNPTEDSKMLDIACGKGRHSIFLNKKGYDVTGIDLSIASIKFAKQFENEKLSFFVHDMRKLLYINYFDYAFNLFTSFGYFETDKEHVDALTAFSKGLKSDGKLILDYMNSQKIINKLVESEVKEVDGIVFNLKRYVENGKIIKSINFTDNNQTFNFKEEVKAFKLEDFKALFKAAGLEITETFGDYHLNPYNVNESERLIFVCKKTC